MKLSKIFLFLIFLLAIFFRFNNLNWDSNQHLHPDERFLTMVNTAQKFPNNMNPANVGYKFFVYGTFPLSLNKAIAVFFGNDNYNALTIQGRFLSAFFDLLTLILVYKIAGLLINKINKTDSNRFQLISTFLYAIAVFPIQLSHFFAVDTFLTFFMIGSFYFALQVGYARPLQKTIILSAIFFGLALACKISAIYILPLNLLIIFFGLLKQKRSFLFHVSCFISYVICCYFVLRLADPYLFQSRNFLDPLPSDNFIKNIKELTVLSSGQIAYPPAIQWYSKKPLFLLINTAVFGLGLPYFVLMIIGIIKVLISNNILNIKNKKLPITDYRLSITLLWVLGLFSYQSFQFVKSMRYTIYLYPFFALFAGIGMDKVIEYWKLVIGKKKIILLGIGNWLLVILLLLWPFMFSSIYFHKHSRVEASEWIYKNLPTNSLILSEHWDDALPLFVEKNYGKQFKIQELPVFDPDTPEKWQKMNELLGKADYYILSSNRGWGSIPTVPERYPQMSKFYEGLLLNRTNYGIVKEFTSYPKFSIFNFQFSINDQWSEELFTVYDHPKVMLFKRDK